jgi:hypothetical protein
MVNKVEDSTFIQMETKDRFSRREIYKRENLITIGILAILFFLSLGYRLNNLNNSRHLGEVQYRAALIARSIYFNFTDSIPEWRRVANAHSLQNLPVKEPPITEIFTVVFYKLLGNEDIRIPRLITSIFWLVGGFFLYKIIKERVSFEGAIVALGYYLFIPLGIVLSTSFQPDSLMVMMFIISLYAILNYYDKPAWKNLIIAAILSGFAILVKPFVLFTISGAFLGLLFYMRKGNQQNTYKKLFVFFFICGLPTIFYYGYMILITRQLMRQAEVSFLPQLLLTKDYWKDWTLTAINAVKLTPLLAAIVGIPMARSKHLRAMILGLGGGYLLFCMVFTYHIRYAPYYHAQLIPIVALSFASILPVITKEIRALNNQWYWSLFPITAIFFLLLMNFRETNDSFRSHPVIERKDVAEEIGEIVNHSQATVYIASYYGRPLEYYGELTGTYWPRSISDLDSALGINQVLTVEDRFKKLEFDPEYFIITDFSEYNRHHPDLKEYLSQNFPVKAHSEHFLIYQLSTGK